MNRSRQAFERFEKSDSWLPVILLSLLGVSATIGCIWAINLLRSNVRLGIGVHYFLGDRTGTGYLAPHSLAESGSDVKPDVALKMFGEVGSWGSPYKFVAGYELKDGLPASAKSRESNRSVYAFFWLSDDNRNLVSIYTQGRSKVRPDSIDGRLAGATVTSIENETGRQFQTTSRIDTPAAPWESIVPLGSESSVTSEELFAAHAQHVSGKDLESFDELELTDFFESSHVKRVHWLIQRGGFNYKEAVYVLDRVQQNGKQEFSEDDRTAYVLGVRHGMASVATFHALTAYAKSNSVRDFSGLVVMHPCASPLEIAYQLKGDPLRHDFLEAKLLEDEQLAPFVADAKSNGIELPQRVDAHRSLLEREELFTKVYEMDEPFPATIYKAKIQTK